MAYALEAAARIKDKDKDTKIVVLSMGPGAGSGRSEGVPRLIGGRQGLSGLWPCVAAVPIPWPLATFCPRLRRRLRRLEGIKFDMILCSVSRRSTAIPRRLAPRSLRIWTYPQVTYGLGSLAHRRMARACSVKKELRGRLRDSRDGLTPCAVTVTKPDYEPRVPHHQVARWQPTSAKIPTFCSAADLDGLDVETIRPEGFSHQG